MRSTTTAPGTVVATPPGALASQEIRICHVAIASPPPGTNDYAVDPAAIAHGMRNAMATARAERADFEPQLASIAFPLLGAADLAVIGFHLSTRSGTMALWL